MNEKKPKLGRKPADDPKVNISVYIKTSIVEKNGGKEIAKEKVINYLETEAKKEKK
ncbi:MAG: hypothetical protein HC854_08865 [Flavobacterium sp.]|nr:hypothetical protein [Flavobacterium sp.]